jgi:transcription elongation GreA/GreB family factor
MAPANPINKAKLLGLVVAELKKQKEQLEKNAESVRRNRLETPSPTESHSDRTRFEMEVVYSALQDTLGEYEKALNVLMAFVLPEKKPDRVVVGAIVEIEDAARVHHVYFLLPESKGITVECEGNRCSVFTPMTPLGKLLGGKMVGDTVSLNGRKITISDLS